jgi:hypothetical protein
MEAVIVQKVGSMVVKQGEVVLIQMNSTIEEQFVFALSRSAAAGLAQQLQRQLSQTPIGD